MWKCWGRSPEKASRAEAVGIMGLGRAGGPEPTVAIADTNTPVPEHRPRHERHTDRYRTEPRSRPQNTSRGRGAAAGPAGAPAAVSSRLAPRSSRPAMPWAAAAGGSRGERAAGSGESGRRPGGGRAPSAAPGLQGLALAPRPVLERPPAPGLTGLAAVRPYSSSPLLPGGVAASGGAEAARARLCDEDREGFKKRAASLCFWSEQEDEVLLVGSHRSQTSGLAQEEDRTPRRSLLVLP
ncbi:Diphosphoinositol polyphosphate phosphohydrolase NUDT4B [Camelus dromedarius]|uniref:Diphosphoinositol polyphosphate phosphohydrolase NUDT4B n=1 Tax=Camelus dromedarius TaxID=9838 RepID=A0A5N4BX50_CAMDR|nr:Diphosphoinositol polyphosphate phosphohydrolase NUDT4B [Camelus dromedarius]